MLSKEVEEMHDGGPASLLEKYLAKKYDMAGISLSSRPVVCEYHQEYDRTEEDGPCECTTVLVLADRGREFAFVERLFLVMEDLLPSIELEIAKYVKERDGLDR